MTKLLVTTAHGLFCPLGGFYIDPWKPVERAIITHAHADHARPGCGSYLGSHEGRHLLTTRLGADIDLETLAYGEGIDIHGVRVSLHPAGHVLGSAQIRVEYEGEIVVASGDYKLADDPTCTPFEPVKCHTFITESTFGLPIYKWQSSAAIFAEIDDWRRGNIAAGKCSVIYSYSLGKAQRLMAGIDPTLGPIYLHGAVDNVTSAYRASGVALPETLTMNDVPKKHSFAGATVIAPPSASGGPWTRRFEPASDAMASGWMLVRGTRRRRALDRGFVLSDHADWPGLLSAIEATGCENVLVTHGFTAELARYLRERGLNADTLATQYEGEVEELSPAEAESRAAATQESA